MCYAVVLVSARCVKCVCVCCVVSVCVVIVNFVMSKLVCAVRFLYFEFKRVCG